MVFLLFIQPFFAFASIPPVLNFSDLISGPSTGLGDGKGSGVIVTVWGQNLGSSQGSNKIEYCDASDICRPGYVYYWKNADGMLPSGPAKLYESHKMQEIAFSIPESAPGSGRIKVTVNGTEAIATGTASGYMPFTVRPGKIYHVKSTGNDSKGDGSFNNPWLSVGKADSIATAGDTLYMHNTNTYGEIEDTSSGGSVKQRAYYNNSGFKATPENQFAYVSYPNTRANLYGKVGFQPYNTTGIVTSKLSVFASNCADETLDGCTERGTVGISPSDWGRVIGNKVTDREGMCASGQAGAISGGIDTIAGAKIYGNYVHDYSCPNADKLHHTTYITIRDLDNDSTIAPPDFGWNYLKDNYARNGIHYYDEDNGHTNECGDWSDTILIHNNVVVNQGGNGIHYESQCGWTNNAHIYNNVLINVGLPVDIDCTSSCGSTAGGINIGDGKDAGLLGDVYVYNNTIHTWDSQNQTSSMRACIILEGRGDTAQLYYNDNVCYTALDRPFITFNGTPDHTNNISGSKNAWFTSASNPSLAIVPTFDTAPITVDPLLTLNGSQITLDSDSPISNRSTTSIGFDIYGTPRKASHAIGAVTSSYIKALAKPASNLGATPIK